MTNLIIIILIILALIYYWKQKNSHEPKNNPDYLNLKTQLNEVIKINKILANFCQQEIGGKDINEIRSQLNGKKLSEILEQNEDFELEVDTLTRKKNELESELLAQSNSYRSHLKEKNTWITKLQKDLKAEQVKVNKWFNEYKEVKDELTELKGGKNV